ncbi:TerC family protein [Desulforegula conservatrix]|uniref:TerC family protein n=1 Tax=Desulforegula conservatrix TaxID=153026 RepID=UPI00040719F3|nr:TerC family protein [Desulforegula conservatrix]
MIWLWICFLCLVFVILALDLGIFHRNAHVVSFREAMGWSFVWITLGLSFTVFIYYAYELKWFGIGLSPDVVDGVVNSGRAAALKYLTGYVVEKSLSVDNIFVIAMIFSFFGVPQLYQHRVLYWGILGALVLRGGMIVLGAGLIAQFNWIMYVFGVFLIITGIKMFFIDTDESDLNNNFVIRLIRRFVPVTERYHGQHFLVKAGSKASKRAPVKGGTALRDKVVERAKKGALLVTPLGLALVMIETTDLIFAVDSIPAIFAITADPFIVFTSNVFAILGLRSLYFALAGMMDKFRYLKVSLACILTLVGAKMLVAEWLKEQLGEHFGLYLLGMIVLILALGVIFSLIIEEEKDLSETE